MTQHIICFGETLWDILPTGKMPGGAPMNVAIHLSYNGFTPSIISRVGNDDLGKELLTFLKSKQIPTNRIQQGETHLTGVVKANISDKNEVTYKIVEPVAWDYIQYDEQVAELVRQSDVFIFGSLAARNTVTRDTLLRYLPLAKLKIFDVNLRPPHYNQDLLKTLLHQADIVKMNHQELEEIISWYDITGDEQQQMSFVKKEFKLQLLIVTRGENGAAVLTGQGYAEHPGYIVEVQDTIGSGDAFLATFLTNFLRLLPIPKALERACLLGAFVATQHGATPTYDPQEVEEKMADLFHLEPNQTATDLENKRGRALE
ncbi:carbohydrate kinase [Pontibacter qinzhouensis]|uniref:Carbohydrate kinase n=1 Tax=Pontibacter qinzhouensis TaxID=2603253 RepID=A0A5C8K5P9_9BACT|nr:carbohydrate kinase [Pontibacter qinzhouensis]TXK46098.1 carbohydrate kinase [Pontibacter qinzhouensis]